MVLVKKLTPKNIATGGRYNSTPAAMFHLLER
jgi:hypothetical protein